MVVDLSDFIGYPGDTAPPVQAVLSEHLRQERTGARVLRVGQDVAG